MAKKNKSISHIKKCNPGAFAEKLYVVYKSEM